MEVVTPIPVVLWKTLNQDFRYLTLPFAFDQEKLTKNTKVECTWFGWLWFEAFSPCSPWGSHRDQQSRNAVIAMKGPLSWCPCHSYGQFQLVTSRSWTSSYSSIQARYASKVTTTSKSYDGVKDFTCNVLALKCNWPPSRTSMEKHSEEEAPILLVRSIWPASAADLTCNISLSVLTPRNSQWKPGRSLRKRYFGADNFF